MHRWETGTRYYLAVAQQDLFGEWELYRAWGARGSGHGGCMREAADSQEDAIERLQAVSRQRAKRGYVRAAAEATLTGTGHRASTA